MFQQRTWILQRSNIELLRECQRIIQEQFSERLSLAQNDLIEKIFFFSTKTNHPHFNDAVERLKDSLAEASFDITQLPGCESDQLLDQPPSNSAKRIYRGRQVTVELSEQALQGDNEVLTQALAESTDTKAKPKRVYRGRVVHDV